MLFVKDIQAQWSSVPWFFQNLWVLEEWQIETHIANVPGVPVQLSMPVPGSMDHLMVVVHGILGDTLTASNWWFAWVLDGDLIEAIWYQAWPTPECIPTTDSWSDIIEWYETGFGEQDICVKAAPLPVEFSRFDIRGWSSLAVERETASEINVKEFVVEVSVDGKTFLPVRTEPAVGNSSQPEKYGMTLDPEALAGAMWVSVAGRTLYVRLNMVDNDGSSAYGPMKATQLNGKGPQAGLEVRGNLLRAGQNEFTVTYDGKAKDINIFTVMWQPVPAQWEDDGNGSIKMTFTGEWTTGVHVIYVTDENGVVSTAKISGG